MTVSTDPYALIVDDDPIILMDLDGILSDAGFRCVEADHGDAALAMLPGHADSITLLFSDVEMPGGTNGFALARHVASTYPWIEIVIASGCGSAWKRDPVSGVIGVEKGPLILVF